MTYGTLRTIATALAIGVASTLAWQAKAGRDLVKFPENYAEGVLYAAVERNNLKEEIFTSRAAIDAVKNGQPISSIRIFSFTPQAPSAPSHTPQRASS
jgi:hypothetical protein